MSTKKRNKYKLKIIRKEPAGRERETVEVLPCYNRSGVHWKVEYITGGWLYFGTKKDVVRYYKRKGYAVKEL